MPQAGWCLVACIGVARSTWEHGVISHANPAALALGVQIGQTLIANFYSINTFINQI
jgi:hypothetical protein